MLRRQGLSRLTLLDRPTALPIRYEREHPGELVHIDVKKLGKIRPGGGWKMLGKSQQTKAVKGRGAGYDYLHVAIDVHSRYAYVEVLANERGETCAGFVMRAAAHMAEQGIRIQRVMTDQAKNYTLSKVFAAALVDIGASHQITQPYRPQTNGKAERFNRTMLDEWRVSTARTDNGWPRPLDGSRPTIAGDLTPRWVAPRRSHGWKQREWELQLAQLVVGSSSIWTTDLLISSSLSGLHHPVSSRRQRPRYRLRSLTDASQSIREGDLER